MREILDIAYRTIGGKTLYLDLFLPGGPELPPLIFWIHGGAWMMGDRKWCGAKAETGRGYAVASVDYRLSTEAPFPACIEDCKYALAFLRENAGEYPVDFSRVCVAGDSAGGHLAALMGVSSGHADWEPGGADCSVQAVIDYFGPSWLMRERPQSWHSGNPQGSEEDRRVVGGLLGVPVDSPKGLMAAAAASPVTYIDGTEPPFLILHGDKDDIVSIEQSRLLRNELEKHGVPVAMHTVFGGGHCFESNPAAEAVVKDFLDYHFNRVVDRA
ncbi:MAG: alpha/beta hydrolase [Oscillospiraceae bacterium]|nr:alpha/beta hydrolase [Oscillospiraceae bacterium]